jgi:hypothetical protein
MFNLQDYETVEERLEKFWKQYPDGRIETELIEATGTRFIVLARLFRTEADSRYWTSGLAYENISERGVNSTSALENCETSAIGRALANAGFASKGKRPSREEMSKTVRGTFERTKPTGGITQPDAWTIKVENPADEFEVKDSKMPEPGLADLLVTELGAQEVHTCKHGQMQLMNGIGKTDKPYMGYVCRATPRSAQCPPIWYRQTPSGKWVKPEEVN